jgi:peptidoglycan/LPS O-acetylase OafA/YrhL
MQHSLADIRRLEPRLVVALDAARGSAACYVALYHVATARQWNTHGVGLLLRFGQEAVLIFFLLSGFVIFANERIRALHPYGYFWRRLRRIYPALLVALIVSTLVAYDNGDLARRFNFSQLIGTLLNLQDTSGLKPGVIVDPYLGNDPLWSLSYEMFFYLIFPPVLMAWTRWPKLSNLIIGFSCCLLYASFSAFPNHFFLVGAYFLVWWSGAMAAAAYQAGSSSFWGMRDTLVWLVALCAVAGIVMAIVGFRGVGYYPALSLRHFVVAALLLLLLFGPFGGSWPRFSCPSPLWPPPSPQFLTESTCSTYRCWSTGIEPLVASGCFLQQLYCWLPPTLRIVSWHKYCLARRENKMAETPHRITRS